MIARGAIPSCIVLLVAAAFAAPNALAAEPSGQEAAETSTPEASSDPAEPSGREATETSSPEASIDPAEAGGQEATETSSPEASGDTADPSAGKRADPVVQPSADAPPPPFMRYKRRTPDADLADKTEGSYFTGLPLLNSDPDLGIGFGARVLHFDNGPRDGALFAYTPYRHRVFAQAFATSNGFQYHWLDLDAPYVNDSPYRVRASFYFEKNIAANYFGVGERSLGRLSFPGSDRRFSSLSEYTEALRQVQPNGTAFTRYDQYVLERPTGLVSVERDFFGGLVRGLVGLSVSHASVRQWTNESVDAAGDVSAPQAPTRLHGDCVNGLVIGCAGGWNNTLRLGFVLDTRDFEPDPNSGYMLEIVGDLSGSYTLSEFDWARVTVTHRAFWSPFPKLADLVIAGRLLTSFQTDGVPIFAMNQLSSSDMPRNGLGGLRTIRGFKQDRFVGQMVALVNLEVRWTFAETDVKLGKRQHFSFMLAPFIDVGRVFDSALDFELARFRNGQGAGLRVAWNQATIIAVDYGLSREGSGLYINFQHPF